MSELSWITAQELYDQGYTVNGAHQPIRRATDKP